MEEVITMRLTPCLVITSSCPIKLVEHIRDSLSGRNYLIKKGPLRRMQLLYRKLQALMGLRRNLISSKTKSFVTQQPLTIFTLDYGLKQSANLRTFLRYGSHQLLTGRIDRALSRKIKSFISILKKKMPLKPLANTLSKKQVSKLSSITEESDRRGQAGKLHFRDGTSRL